MIDIIRNDLKKVYPPDVCDALINSYIELKEQYYLGKHEPAELNGGKFCEACLRLIQYSLTGKYTPIGDHIPNIPLALRNFENEDKTKHDSFRLHIPRVLIAMYNIRNRRGVGHLSGDANPSLTDSTLILSLADWILTELYRIVYSVSLDEAQYIVNNLIKRKMLLIHKIGNIKRVLDPALTIRDQTLLLLYNTMPESMTDEELLVCIEYKNKSYFEMFCLINYTEIVL
ncbi:hypothetical protein ACFLXY_03765 [Chloroflexota bacterium]